MSALPKSPAADSSGGSFSAGDLSRVALEGERAAALEESPGVPPADESPAMDGAAVEIVSVADVYQLVNLVGKAVAWGCGVKDVAPSHDECNTIAGALHPCVGPVLGKILRVVGKGGPWVNAVVVVGAVVRDKVGIYRAAKAAEAPADAGDGTERRE